MTAATAELRGGGERLAEVSKRLVQLFAERVGRGPTRAKTHWAGDDALLVLLGGGLTRGEQTLDAKGLEAEAEEYRRALQHALESEMRCVVEEVLGRRVIAFMSASHREPDLTAELFHPGADLSRALIG